MDAVSRLLGNNKLSRFSLFLLPTYLSALISLFTFPIVANLLGVRGFGQLDLFLLIGTALNFGFNFGWDSAHNRYYFENNFSQDDLIRTLLIFRLFITFIVCGCFYIFKDNLNNLLGISNDQYLSIFLMRYRCE